MTIDKMTSKAQEAVRTAVSMATRRGHPEIHPEHLCSAVISQEGGVARPLVDKAGGNLAVLEKALRDRLDSFPQVTGGSEAKVSHRTLTVLQQAEDEAKAMKDEFISTEHILLAGAKKDREL